MSIWNIKYVKNESKPLDEKIKYKFSLFLICTFIATFFWFVIKLSAEYTTIVYYPIKFTNLPQDRIIHSTPDSLLRLLVKAKGFRIMNTESLRETSILELDISNMQAYRSGKYFYASLPSSKLVNQISSQIGQGISLLSITPDTLTFVFEPVIEKTLPVIFNGEIIYEKGYFLYDTVVVEPARINVIGPQHTVDSLQVIHTVTKRLSGIKSKTEFNVPLILPKETRFSDVSLPTVRVIIPVEAYDEVTREYPVQIGAAEKKQGWKINPQFVTVTLKVARKDINRFDPGSIGFYIDPTEYISDTISTLKVKHSRLPVFVKMGSILPDVIEVQPLSN